jgi:hypothetical protein
LLVRYLKAITPRDTAAAKGRYTLFSAIGASAIGTILDVGDKTIKKKAPIKPNRGYALIAQRVRPNRKTTARP